jgi:hypothetical protein
MTMAMATCYGDDPTSNQTSTPSPSAAVSSVPPLSLSHEDRISIVRNHFIAKGYRVHSGLQFGCELVLYSDSPALVHSDFCVHVPADACGALDWRTLQTLVRMMPDLRKTLIVAHVVSAVEEENDGDSKRQCVDGELEDATPTQPSRKYYSYAVHELAFATEHAPFRHKNIPQGVGTQVKPQSTSQSSQKGGD